ncbi:MAG TPA: cytochrome c3 family protein [Bacteroidia bacterium]|nr:cytochrome c3 family protein [Bacteroidia bacterium]
MRFRYFLRVILPLVTALLFFSLVLQNCGNAPESTAQSDSTQTAVYIGSETCKGCHANEHLEWTGSHHYMAMLPANDTTVEGNFNNVTLTADGVTSRFFKKDGKFIINTQGEDGANHDYEVLYTFGFTPLQQYLVKFPDGKMQVPRTSWDTIQKKWYHQYAGTKIPAHDWLHWTGNAQNWNTMCAACHSTNLLKGYDIKSDSYHTTYSEINVSCESCHGPGSKHVAYIKGDSYASGKKIAGSQLLLGKNSGQNEVLNTCALCHSRKTDISATIIPSQELLDNYIPQTPTNEFFFADGQMNGEVYNYTSFLESKMYRRGIKCTDCHNPHSGKLLANGNNMCAKCHAPEKFDVPSHTFHQPGTAASECKSCHMYAKEYMGNDLRHDHSFRVPRSDLSAKYGTPNTCNSCHADKSAKWAADAIVKNYGPKRAYHFSDDLIEGSKLDEKSFAHLQRLLNDTTVPGIIKATAAEYMGNLVSEETLEALLNNLNSTDAHVRYRSLRSLENFPVSSYKEHCYGKLSDPVRAVRIAAAGLYAGLSKEELAGVPAEPLAKALGELENYTLHQTDFAIGNSLAGDFYTKRKNYQQAEFFYQRAIKKDSLMNYARLNLSAVLSSLGKNDDALRVLNEAINIDSGNERAYYNKALLQVETNDTKGAMNSFSKAVELRSENPRLYYNYGLLMQQLKEPDKAEKVLLEGITVDPLNGDLNYALALLYINQGKSELAAKPISVLQQYHSTNPAYFSLTRKSSR